MLDENIKLPIHIGVIMDGNRRWAKKRNLIPQLGHKEGAENLKKLAASAEKMGIKYLTVYAFSTENWNRSKDEVDYLMNLFLTHAKSFINRSKDIDYKIQLVGDKSRLSEALQKEITYIEEETKNNNGLVLNICINYGGKAEISNAVKMISKEVLENKISIDDITPDFLNQYMQTKDTPDADLIIRTGGEQRISGFLMWQSAYAEYYFTDVYFPDFDEKELEKAIIEFSNRKRNFGK